MANIHANKNSVKRKPFVVDTDAAMLKRNPNLSSNARHLYGTLRALADGRTGELRWKHSGEWMKATAFDREAEMCKNVRMPAMRELVATGLVTTVRPRILRMMEDRRRAGAGPTQYRRRAVAGPTQYTVHREPISPKVHIKARKSSKVHLQKSISSTVEKMDQQFIPKTPSTPYGGAMGVDLVSAPKPFDVAVGLTPFEKLSFNPSIAPVTRKTLMDLTEQFFSKTQKPLELTDELAEFLRQLIANEGLPTVQCLVEILSKTEQWQLVRIPHKVFLKKAELYIGAARAKANSALSDKQNSLAEAVNYCMDDRESEAKLRHALADVETFVSGMKSVPPVAEEKILNARRLLDSLPERIAEREQELTDRTVVWDQAAQAVEAERAEKQAHWDSIKDLPKAEYYAALIKRGTERGAKKRELDALQHSDPEKWRQLQELEFQKGLVRQLARIRERSAIPA